MATNSTIPIIPIITNDAPLPVRTPSPAASLSPLSRELNIQQELMYDKRGSEMDTQYEEYIIIYTDQFNKFGAVTDVMYIDHAQTWNEIIQTFIDTANEFCPEHTSLHLPCNIKRTGSCYRFQYRNILSTCCTCDSLWCILPIPNRNRI